MRDASTVTRVLSLVVVVVVMLLMESAEAHGFGGRGWGFGWGGLWGRMRNLNTFLERCLCGSDACAGCFNRVEAGNITTYADLGACLDAANVTALTMNTPCRNFFG
ncbi:uncharacterized protein LOC127007209 [Eriocheir sinensis]|uniref:uncharacterized protein LOC127007209 n=1 Tax=Eriocheir sinensis TaxID=95602 RepID=UPI0021C8C291|nr:uncharacterized protein LOC127007209 [Eriocheir sinensis]